MEKNKPTAFKATQLVDEVIERLILYLTRSQQPLHTAALEVMISDLKQVKRLLFSLESKETIERMTSLELCNQLFLRVLRKLRKSNKYFPFSVYVKAETFFASNKL